MKKYLKAITAFAIMTFASLAWAAEQTVSLGYKDSSSSVEMDLREYGYQTGYGSVALYCNGDLVFCFDQGGVLYVQSGVYWWQDSNGFMHVSNLPDGEYTGGLSVNSAGSFSTSSQTITWVSNFGPTWLVVDFL